MADILKTLIWWTVAVLCLCAIPYFSMCGAADVQAEREGYCVARGER
jgi:hypothetical protein